MQYKITVAIMVAINSAINVWNIQHKSAVLFSYWLLTEMGPSIKMNVELAYVEFTIAKALFFVE